MESIRVFLVDDHALLRAGLTALLGESPGIAVVGEAADGRVAVDRIAAAWPDVVLTDIHMPGVNGLELAARLRQQLPDVRVVFLTMHLDEEYVREALRIGAAGYVHKDADAAELELAVRAASRGQTYISPAVSAHLVADYRRVADAGPGPSAVLTARQLQVLRLIASGVTTKGIANRLGLSAKTVETHRSQLMDRLKIYDVAGLVRYAVRTGLITVD